MKGNIYVRTNYVRTRGGGMKISVASHFATTKTFDSKKRKAILAECGKKCGGDRCAKIVFDLRYYSVNIN